MAKPGIRIRAEIPGFGLLELRTLVTDYTGTLSRGGKITAAVELGVDRQKLDFVTSLDPRAIAAFANGNNDRVMLKSVKEAGGLAAAVDNGEGCAVQTLLNASLFITDIESALDLLLDLDLDVNRQKATLRF